MLVVSRRIHPFPTGVTTISSIRPPIPVDCSIEPREGVDKRWHLRGHF